MSSSVVYKLITVRAKVFDKKRRKLLLPASTLWLVKNSPTSGYQLLEEITSGWFVVYDRYRNLLRIQVARHEFTNLPKGAKWVYNRNVFSFSDGDTIKPDARRPFWEFFVTNTGETFTL